MNGLVDEGGPELSVSSESWGREALAEYVGPASGSAGQPPWACFARWKAAGSNAHKIEWPFNVLTLRVDSDAHDRPLFDSLPRNGLAWADNNRPILADRPAETGKDNRLTGVRFCAILF